MGKKMGWKVDEGRAVVNCKIMEWCVEMNYDCIGGPQWNLVVHCNSFIGWHGHSEHGMSAPSMNV